MRKISIGKKIYDVVDEKEYIRRITYDREMADELASDTAIDPGDGNVYPVVNKYSENNMGVTDCGPVLLYSNPDNFPNKEEYKAENIIDFEKTKKEYPKASPEVNLKAAQNISKYEATIKRE